MDTDRLQRIQRARSQEAYRRITHLFREGMGAITVYQHMKAAPRWALLPDATLQFAVSTVSYFKESERPYPDEWACPCSSCKKSPGVLALNADDMKWLQALDRAFA